MTISTGSVSQWNDKSGNGYSFANNATLTPWNYGSSYYPTITYGGLNNQNIVTFNNQSLGCVDVFPSGNAQSFSIFLVGTSFMGRGEDGYGGGWSVSIPDYLGSIVLVANGAAGYTMTNGSGLLNYLELAQAGTSVIKTYNSGSLIQTQSVANYTLRTSSIGLEIGRRSGYYKNGYIAEILIYTRVLSTTERQQVESYLAQKWGLTASIPVGHLHLTQQAGAVTTTALSKFKVIGLPQRFMSATGGTVTTVGSFKFHTFTYPGGTFTVTANPSTVQALVVGGGGGGGGYYNGGGGGAGGAVYNSSFSVSITSYTVTIGNGGAGASGGNNPGINGTSGGASTFSTLTGNGGGGGGADNYVNGLTGGCGGGMGPLGASAPGSGNQGYAGGYGTNGPNMGTLGGAYGSGYGGGGGGGMGSVGSNALTSAGPGYGGTGYTYVVGGQNYLVAGGGGGGTADTDNTNFGLGGSSIGGVGGLNSARVAGNGAANTGSGGGGYGRVGTGSAGGSGGTGIVVIAYRVS
jgi:hypothetical protein